MLTINERQFVAVDEPIPSYTRIHGFYEVKRGRKTTAIRIIDCTKTIKALVSPDGCIVTASKLNCGQEFYMFGTTKETETFLGIEGFKYSTLADMGRAAIRSVTR